MARQNEPLTQKKPWSELTEEEREAIRESWKHTLPEEFDVFCIGKLKYSFCKKTLKFPGRLYVRGNVDCYDISVAEDFIVGDNVECGDVGVSGSITVYGNINCCAMSVVGDVIVDGDIDCYNISVDGDCIIRRNIDSHQINVGGLFDCYDVQSNGKEIHAADYVCRYYEYCEEDI